MITGKHILFSLALLFSASVSIAQKSPSSESDLKKQAEKLFEKESYQEAAPMYSQLLSLYPRDAVFNYRYGICLIMSGQDKTGAAPYLEAAAKVKETDPDVHYYLGRSYMFSDRFNDAIAEFNQFKKTGTPGKQTKLGVDRAIENCNNANVLRMSRKNVVVLQKTKISRAAFFAAYDFTDAAGKLLTTPDRFLTPIDKTKMPNPVMFMTKDGETIYFASYGKKGENGRDLYKVVKLSDGSWGEPANLGGTVNTNVDEDYPYLDKDGRTLYFSSTGHNSIGGYDVFKTQYDFNSGRWNDPVNVGIPINTVDDDLFFMPSTKGETASYSTAVETETGKIEYRNLGLGKSTTNLAIISGQYISEDQVTRRDARITVIRSRDNGVVTSVKTDRMGQYELVLPAGEDYTLVVEGGSYLPHAESFSVPSGNVPGMHQKVAMNKTTETEVLTMSNYFTPSEIDASMASLEKPTEVKKSEFDIKDTATTKLQTITFEGRTIFVAAPTLKSSDMKSVDGSGLAVNEKNPDTTISGQTNATDKVAETASGEVKNAVVIGEPENVKEATTISAGASDKTTNTELVKMAFDDAQTLKEEANNLRHEAVESRLEAHSLDSLSKEQLKQANQLLASGDQELSKEVFKQSQENILASQDKTKEAKQFDTDANAKDQEYETSYLGAVQLMKEFKVDTNSTSYQAIALKESEGQESGNDEVSAGQSNNPHTIRSRQLAVEADSLLSESKYVEEQALATSDKKQKAFLHEKAKELNDQGESRLAESRLESNLAEKDKKLAAASEVKEVKTGGVEDKTTGTAGKQTADQKTAETASAKNTASDESSPASQPESKSSNPPANNESAPDVKTENTAAVITSAAIAGVATASQGNKAPIERKPKQKLAPVPNVDPAAQQHFENYSDQLDESKFLSAKSKETEEKLLSVNTPSTRDSLQAKTISLNQESIKLWQSANQELAIAKEIEPAIEVKMANAEKTRAMQTEQADAKEANAEKQLAVQSEQGASKQANAENNSVKEESKSGTETGNVSPAISEAKPGTSTNAPASEAKPLPGNEEKSISPAVSVPATVNQNQPEPAAEVLDTTRPAYPEYKATQKEITEKQTETVNIFVEGMQLSKKATEIKKEEMKLRDQAVVSTDKKEKEKLEVRADSLAMESELLSDKSKSMLSVAQKNTTEVKALTAKSDKLKEELVVKSTPEEQTQPVAVASTPTGSVNKESGNSSADSTVAMVPSSENKSAEGQIQPGVETQSTPEKKENAKQNQENITTENKPAESNVQPGTKSETRNVVPAVTGAGIAVEENKSSTGTTTENKSSGTVKESEPASSATTTPANEINPVTSEEPSATVNEKVEKAEPVAGTNEKVSESAPAGEGQTKVEKELNASGQQPSKLVFENEVSDATTFSLAKTNSNTASNVIPMNPVLPEGLVFKVQIGAFRKPLPASSFNNLQPLSGETTRPGWIRYCLGLFRTFEPANLLKKEVRSMGYKDAFVVAYYNGKRIPLYEAYAIISKANASDKQTYSTVSTNEFKQLEKFEIKKSSYDLKPDADTKAFYGTKEIVPAELVEYAVQVGVYKTSRTPSALASLVPLNTEQMTSGLYRYTTGRFDNRQSADSMKRIAVNTGIKDAFVVIYRGGKKVGQREAQQNASTTRKETTPVVPAVSKNAAPKTIPSQPSNETVNASDIVFKIQLGAFRENVPFNTVSSFLAIADKGISQETDARGLHIFYAGQYTDYNEALTARSEIVTKGVKDAFIVAFVKGKRTSATEALKLLNRN